MYKHKARIEHRARLGDQQEDEDTPFDMDSVTVPALTRKPHAESTAYRSQVGNHFTWAADSGSLHLSSLDMIRGA